MIKASIILAAACCSMWLLRRRSAAERHLVWAAAIIAAAVLPLLTVVLPAWRPALAQRVTESLPVISRLQASSSSDHANVTFRAYAIESTGKLARLWPIAWLAGSVIGLLMFGAGIIQQRRFAGRSVRFADPELEAMTSGFRRGIHLKKSLDDPMPMTWGLFRPAVLFPKGIDEWPAERKRIVLAHELAHIRRLDYFFQSVAEIACALYWFNPLFWFASSRLQRESEHACDDAVINLGIDAREYASHLLGVARAVKQSRAVWSATLAMAKPSTLEKRFSALLTARPNRRALSRRTALGATILTLGIVLPLAAMRFSTNESAKADSGPPRIDQYTTPPLYSDEARALGIEGVVTVEAQVSETGRPARLRVVKGLGHGLNENALLAVQDWRFVPALRNGNPIEATARFDVEFSLRTAELNEDIANDMATRIGPGVTPPQVVHRVDPQYEGTTTHTTSDGAVILDAVILEEGMPRIVRVIRSQGWELDEIAINALRQWRFSPAMKDGQPIKVRMNIAISFGPR